MKSDKIKITVTLTTLIISTNDTSLQDESTRTKIKELLVYLVSNCIKSPMFAISIVQYLSDNDFVLLSLDCEEQRDFLSKFGSMLGSISEDKLLAMRVITNRLFR